MPIKTIAHKVNKGEMKQNPSLHMRSNLRPARHLIQEIKKNENKKKKGLLAITKYEFETYFYRDSLYFMDFFKIKMIFRSHLKFPDIAGDCGNKMEYYK